MAILEAFVDDEIILKMQAGYAAVHEHSGLPMQALHTLEEFAEAAKAVSKRVRGSGSVEDVAEEFVDCLIVMDKMCRYFQITREDIETACALKTAKFVRIAESCVASKTNEQLKGLPMSTCIRFTYWTRRRAGFFGYLLPLREVSRLLTKSELTALVTSTCKFTPAFKWDSNVWFDTARLRTILHGWAESPELVNINDIDLRWDDSVRTQDTDATMLAWVHELNDNISKAFAEIESKSISGLSLIQREHLRRWEQDVRSRGLLTDTPRDVFQAMHTYRVCYDRMPPL